MSTINEARELIERGIADIDAEAEALSSALTALGGNGAKPRKLRSDRGRARQRPSNRRAPQGARRQQFLDAIAGAPDGISVSEAAKQIGMANPQPLYAVAKAVQKEGMAKKQGSKYIAVARPSKAAK